MEETEGGGPEGGAYMETGGGVEDRGAEAGGGYWADNADKGDVCAVVCVWTSSPDRLLCTKRRRLATI